MCCQCRVPRCEWGTPARLGRRSTYRIDREGRLRRGHRDWHEHRKERRTEFGTSQLELKTNHLEPSSVLTTGTTTIYLLTTGTITIEPPPSLYHHHYHHHHHFHHHHYHHHHRHRHYITITITTTIDVWPPPSPSPPPSTSGRLLWSASPLKRPAGSALISKSRFGLSAPPCRPLPNCCACRRT